MLALSSDAMHGFARWVEDIEKGTDGAWSAASFRRAADAMRIDNKVVALALPASAAASVPVAPAQPGAQGVPGMVVDDHPSFESTQMFDFSVASPAPVEHKRRSGDKVNPPSAAKAASEFADIDFGSLASVTQVAPSAVATPVMKLDAPMDLEDLGQMDWGLDSVKDLSVEFNPPTSSTGLSSSSAELPPID